MSYFFKTIGLIWFVVLCITYIVLSVICFLFRIMPMPSLNGILIIFGITLLISIIIFLILFVRESKRPLASLSFKLEMELQKNGFSDRFFEMAEQGKSLYTGASNEFSYYKNIALYGADGYILKEKYDKAFEFINSLDLNEVKHSDSVLRDNGLCIVSYFDIQMELCNEYGDKERANNVFRDAKPYLDKFYGANNVSMVIDEFYFSYYYLNQDYMLAIEHAEAMINNPFHKMNSIIAGYLNLAMAYNKMGDTARSSEILDEAVKIMNNKKNPVSIQSYEYAKKQMEF